MTPVNRFVTNLIDAKRNNFDIGIEIELRELVERIKRKRCIDTRAARKVLNDLLQHEVKAK